MYLPPISAPRLYWLVYKACIVTPLGWGQDDSSQILAAVSACGTGGTITLPAPYVYTIRKRLLMRLVGATLNVFGTLSFVPDLGYWIDESHRIEFQNQSTAWIVEGSDYIIDGGGWMQGGIEGNGQAWYGRAAGHSNQFGRPIPLTLYNSTNATVRNFSVRQSMFWNFYVQDSQDVSFTSIYLNSTNRDPAGNGSNYETNTDGINTIRVNNFLAADWVFHGGDDCLAPKGNSTNLVFRNITCTGGGVAFGSVGQYPGAPDFITNVSATDITVSQLISPAYGGGTVAGGAYFKSWVGHEEGTPPQGGGGGTGRVSNISFENLHVDNTSQGVFVNKCYFKVADQANYCDTSTFLFEDLSFSNVTGTVNGENGIGLNCSAAQPCRDIHFEGVDLLDSADNTPARVVCDNAEDVVGVKCNGTASSVTK
ncbi:pectin lyase-like protein [Rhizodiscina lignyota]|uniref:galacturonan 1,4-alpha-galacturonidase n=1 Tax=Rhizodiscina lignyota TaxID=1504668 RepID=A0A9P4IK42_9PEZI|nr:pectin lyase-like protein [Rhizodiscina lignyota]